MLNKLIDLLKIRKDIGEPPYEYDLLVSLDEKEYPKYLKRMFKANTGKNLNLKHPKTFSEKIQWLKLYDVTPLKTQLTDKVLVRDWVKDKIGSEYLKPVLQICKSFDEIDFSKLPDSFIIKANNGCKWHYKIKNKQKFIETKELFDYIKMRFDNWMIQTFFPWGGFEMQYKDIKPQIIVEPVMENSNSRSSVEYEVYCFNSEPELLNKVYNTMPRFQVYAYNKDYSVSPVKINSEYIYNYDAPIDDNLKKAAELSKVLSKDFKFVRVDWLVYEDKFYFNEMTFTPLAGFYRFEDPRWDIEFGKKLKLK